MNIMRETLLLMVREDLIERLDQYDITSIDEYIAMGVPFADETKELLMMEMNQNLCMEIKEASEKNPEIMQLARRMIELLSKEEKLFNDELVGDIINNIKKLAQMGDIESAQCLNKCFTYYTSFFLDESDNE